MRHPTLLLRGAARRAWSGAQRLRPRPPATDGTGAGAATARLAGLTSAGEHEAAIDLVRRELLALGRDPRFLDEARRAASRAGEPSLQAKVTRAQIAVTPWVVRPARTRLAAALAQVEGRLRETEPGWWPRPAAATRPSHRGAVRGEEGASRWDDGGAAGTLRITHLLKIALPHRQSGYSVRTRYTLEAQREAGLDPVAVTALDFPGEDVPEVEQVHDVRHRHLLRTGPPGAETVDAHLTAYAEALLPVVAEEAPDVLHVHSGARGYDAALVGGAVAAALDLPWVYEVRGFFDALWTQDPGRAESAETYRRRRDTDTRCMLAADAVLTLSGSMRGEIVSRGVPAERVHVVPNGVDATDFAPRPAREDLRTRYGLTGRFVFGYVSNLDHHREGQELLVDAVVALRERGIDAVALVVGDGARRPAIEGHAADLGAGDAVVLTGRVPHEEVLDHYALMDVFVVPRVDERAARLVTPLKPFEAMAAGLPVLVSDLPALTEITGGGERGESFAAGDPRALADALERLAGDPGRRERLASAGRAWVESERSWSANGPRYREVYEQVLRARDAG